MKRYFIHLAYAGQNYRGWQIQKESKNVQGVIEEALSKILHEEIGLVACGRTDAKVHSSQFYAHFTTEKTWDFDLIFRLNKVLPDDIAIYNIDEVGLKSHARYHASKRAYQYFLHTKKNPLLFHISTLYEGPELDYSLMAEAVTLLKGEHDFRSFCKSPDTYPSTLCVIKEVSLSLNKFEDQLCFEISANRFVKGMIRNLMSRLLLVGSKLITVAHFKSLLDLKTQEVLTVPAPPQGLHLSDVQYDLIKHRKVTNPKDMLLHQKDDCWTVIVG